LIPVLQDLVHNIYSAGSLLVLNSPDFVVVVFNVHVPVNNLFVKQGPALDIFLLELKPVTIDFDSEVAQELLERSFSLDHEWDHVVVGHLDE
jgi:hypothetical protein